MKKGLLTHLHKCVLTFNIYLCVCSVVSDLDNCQGPCQAPLSVGFLSQEGWSRLPFPSPGDLSDPGIEPMSLASAGKFFITAPAGKPQNIYVCV